MGDRLGGDQIALFAIDTIENGSYPGCDIDTEGVTPWDEPSHKILSPGRVHPDCGGKPFWEAPIIQWSDGKITKGDGVLVTVPNQQSELGTNLPIVPNQQSELGTNLSIVPNQQSELGTNLYIVPNQQSELGTDLSIVPSSNWIECSSIEKSWVGGIERKTIKNRLYYYWRHYDGKRKASKYLSGDWQKALEKLAKLQTLTTNAGG